MKTSRLIATLVVACAVVVGVGFWWAHARNNPTQVFNDMLRNNLSTSSVTRLVSQQGQGLTITQYTQLNLGSTPTAHALTIFKEKGGTLATEEISNRDSDFVRYQQIKATALNKSGRPLDFSSVLGQWAKLQPGDSMSTTLTSGLFDQALTGVLPIGNLSAAQRDPLLTYIHQNQVFSYDPQQVVRTTLDGRKVYSYTVQVKPAAYVTLMQRFEKLVGVTAYVNVNPASFSKANSITLTIDVDASSHQLARIYQTTGGRIERYEGFGLHEAIKLPKATITTTELTERLAAIQRQ